MGLSPEEASERCTVRVNSDAGRHPSCTVPKQEAMAERLC